MRSRRNHDEAPVTLFSFQDIITSLSGIMIFLVLMLALEVVSRRAATPATSPATTPTATADAAAVAALQAQVKTLTEAVAAARAANAAALNATPLETVRQQVADARAAEALRPDLNRAQAQVAEARTAVSQAEQERDRLQTQLRQLQAQANARASELAKSTVGKRVFFIPEKGTEKNPWLVRCAAGGLRAGCLGKPDSVKDFAATPVGEQELLTFIRGRQPATDAFVVLMTPSGVSLAMGLVGQIQAAGFDVGYDALEEDSEVSF